MKKFLLALGLLIGASSFYTSVEAQNISVNINIGRQPAWGPVGYDYVGYYYFPDLDVYYDVNGGLFVYNDRGRWISSRYLPYGYRDYDLYGLYKVVLNINDPWRYNRIHYRDYARYRGIRTQYVIRDSRDYRYRDSRRNSVVWYSPNYRPDYKYSRPSNNHPNNSVNRPGYNGSKDSNRPSNNNSSRPSYNGSKDSNKPSNSNSSRPSYNGQSSNRPNSSANRPSSSSSNSTSRPSTNSNTNRPSNKSSNMHFVENRTNDSRSSARESSRTINNRTDKNTNSRARN